MNCLTFFSSCLHYCFWNIDASECVHVKLLICVRFLVRLPFLLEGVLIESGSFQLFVTLCFRVLVNSLGFPFRLIFIMLVDCLLNFFLFLRCLYQLSKTDSDSAVLWRTVMAEFFFSNYIVPFLFCFPFLSLYTYCV